LRTGYQKGEPVLVAPKQNRSFETLLQPQGIEVSWLEFEFGSAPLEAMRVGAIDIGAAGDAPPVFAQAARADLVYIVGRPDSSNGSAIPLPPGSTLQTLGDLRGERIAFGKGSSAHGLTIAALQEAGIAYRHITPVTLGPTDALGPSTPRPSSSIPIAMHGRSGTHISPPPRSSPASAFSRKPTISGRRIRSTSRAAGTRPTMAR
jgi:ABC-type nitrate/sulfonate/bicarbonate transport system substrate-binding protein